MDDDRDASSLVSDLLKKLAEFDRKVASYRKDMLDQFHAYSDNLLRDLPDFVSDEVNAAIAASMSSGRFQNLCPPANPYLEPESPAIDRRLWDGRGSSPPPVLHHTSGIPTNPSTGGSVSRSLGGSARNAPRETHAREKEFQGLFTPRYLPLLENQSPPSNPKPTSSTSGEPQSQEKGKASLEASGGGSFIPTFPPRRSFTDPPADCGPGDSTRDRPQRRSALRRSSSTSKSTTSPRRVRFDFDEEEVLPSSPPLPATNHPPSPPPQVEDPSSSAYESYPHKTLSLLDDDDDLPPPKKVSSSQALRALSKLPLEDPSTWTVVNASPDPDPMPADEGTRASTQGQTPVPPNPALHVPSPSDVEEFENQPLGLYQLGSPLQEMKAYDDDDDSASEDDFVSMPTRSPRKKSILSASRAPITPESSTPMASGSLKQPTTAVETKPAAAKEKGSAIGMTTLRGGSGKAAAVEDTDADELFQMDDDAGTSKQPRPYATEEPEPENEAADDEPVLLSGGVPIAAQPSSPSLPVPEAQQERDSPTPPQMSVGSYKGRNITFDVVKSPKVLREAAQAGDVRTFVGSIDGRSGADGIDPSSYRPMSFRGGSSLSGMAFNGTPRSLSERMFLEDLVEEDRSPPKH